MAVTTPLMSASSKTTAAPLPPNSISSRFMDGAPAAAMRWPTAVDPVNETMSTSGDVVRTEAGSGPAELTRLTTPGGNPTSSRTRASLDDGQRVLGGRLHDHGVAHGQGGGHLAGHVGQREVVAGDGGHHADRLAVGQGADQAAGGQRGGRGDDRRQHRLLDVADVPGVAVEPIGTLTGTCMREPTEAVAPVSAMTRGTSSSSLGPDGRRRLLQQGQPLLGRGGRPGREGLPGRGRGGVGVVDRARWGPGPPPASVAGLMIVVGPVAGLDPLAPDQELRLVSGGLTTHGGSPFAVMDLSGRTRRPHRCGRRPVWSSGRSIGGAYLTSRQQCRSSALRADRRIEGRVARTAGRAAASCGSRRGTGPVSRWPRQAPTAR